MEQKKKNSSMLKTIVITRVALAGALFCVVFVGALSALVFGQTPPQGVDLAAASIGGIAAASAKLASHSFFT